MGIVEHESYNTFIKMYTSPTQVATMEKVRDIIDGMPTTRFLLALPGMCPPRPAGGAMHSIVWATQSYI